jgi:hypothetical protein
MNFPTALSPALFSASYHEARMRLLDAAHMLAARHSVLIDSRAIAAKGPGGETLALDWIMIGARQPRRAVVLSSGTHGAEGPVGSAVQLAVAQNVLPTLALPKDAAIILQHGNNPFGYAWSRRVNENNVDLNRNFGETFDPGKCHPGYEALLEAINPPDLDEARELTRKAQMDQFVAEHGARAFQAALSEGQYKYPQGVQFGGHAQQASVRHLMALTREHLSATRQLAWLDYHTGLGVAGECELITGFTPDSRPYALANRLWPGQVKSATSGESLSAPLTGVMDLGLARALPPECDFAFAFPEFGTYPVEHVLQTLRLDNWLAHHGDRASPLGEQLVARMRETFSPGNPDWQTKVLGTGMGFARQAIDALLQ